MFVLDSNRKSRSGIAIFLVLSILVIAVLAGFTLSYFSRANRHAVHRFYLTIMADTLLSGACQEGEEWLAESFSNVAASSQIGDFMRDPNLTWSNLESISIPLDLPHSRLLADEMGVTFTVEIGFRNIRPVFLQQDLGSANYSTNGFIGQDLKECFGIVVLSFSLEHKDFSRDVKLQREFKIINMLPPVVSKFTLFVRDQAPGNAAKGSPIHLNNLYLATGDKLCKGLISEDSKAKPLFVVNSGRDFDPTGKSVTSGGFVPSVGRGNFVPDDITQNIMRKGWIYLGTPSPDGFVLNLTSGQLVDYLGSKLNANLYDSPSDIGQRYAGERFHRPDFAELLATTDGGHPTIYNTVSLNNSSPAFPAEVTADGVADIESFRFKLQFFNFCSLTKDLSDGVAGLESLRLVFQNYYEADAERVGYTDDDYRSHHASLLHLHGSEYYSNQRYYDSRSPSLVLGPVRRKYLAIGSIHQESDYERGTEAVPAGTDDFCHPPQAVAPRSAFMPWFDIDGDGYNCSANPSFTSLAKVIEADPMAGSPPKLPGCFAKRDYYITEIFRSDAGFQTYYKNLSMSRFFEETYIRSTDLIINNNVTEPVKTGLWAKSKFEGQTGRDALCILQPAPGAGDKDNNFFFDANGSVQSGSSLEICGGRLSSSSDPDSSWVDHSDRKLFQGNLAALSLYSETFSFTDPAAASEEYDLRRKSTLRFATFADFKQCCVDDSNPTKWVIDLDGEIVCIEENGPVTIGEAGKEIEVKGSGVLMVASDLIIASNVKVVGEELLTQWEPVNIPPVTFASIGGSILIKAQEIHAGLIALHPEHGTIKRSPGLSKLLIIGFIAVDHFQLGDSLLRETGPNTFESSPDNFFHRQADDWQRMELIYNDRFEPCLWENYNKNYLFKLGQSAISG